MSNEKNGNVEKRNGRKRRKWPWIVGGIVLIFVVYIVATFPSVSSLTALLLNQQSAVVERDTIAKRVIGSGNLEYGEQVDVKAPVGLLIDTVLVESGDYVKKGETLATVNAASIQSQLTDVGDQIKALDQAINRAKDDKEAKKLYANVSGRVKIVYAEEDDDVAERMAKSGALLVLSLDGKMAVDFESKTAFSVGDDVDVVLENGTVKNGTIETASNGHYTVTLTDNGPKYEEAVTVKDEDGNTVATGKLYIHQPISVAGAGGTVDTIHYKENKKVSRGARLITLKDVPATAAYKENLRERDELMDTYQTLVELSQTDSIVSEYSGTVDAVSITEGETVSVPADATGSAAQSSSDSTAVAFTFSTDDSMKLTIKIDELDILSVKTDMKATIVFDAIEGRDYSGTISKLSDSADTSEDSAKYTAEIVMERDDLVRAGMSATATIVVEEKTDVLRIPVEALQEQGSRVFVYTQADGNSGQLSGETDVTTGLSDGAYVEVVSGLAEGSTVYYNINTGNDMFQFGGMNGGMNGGMRNGGGMISVTREEE